MSNVYETFGSSEDLEKDGVWVDIEGMKFKIARAGGGNTEFAKILRKKVSPFKRAIESDKLPEVQAKKLMREVFVDTVLKGWENVNGPDGPIVYSRENALKLMEDLPNLQMEIQRKADMFETFQKEVTESEEKNS